MASTVGLHAFVIVDADGTSDQFSCIVHG